LSPGDALSVEPIRTNNHRPRSLLEVADILNNHETRIASIETSAEILDKVWRFLKIMTPALIGALLASINPDSFLWKFLNGVWKAIQ